MLQKIAGQFAAVGNLCKNPRIARNFDEGMSEFLQYLHLVLIILKMTQHGASIFESLRKREKNGGFAMNGRMQLGIYGTHGTGQFDFFGAKYIVIPEGLFDSVCLVQTGGV